jgi:hypothetical protein
MAEASWIVALAGHDLLYSAEVHETISQGTSHEAVVCAAFAGLPDDRCRMIEVSRLTPDAGGGGETMTPCAATQWSDQLSLGAEVISRDGMYLGKTTAIARPYFHVDAARQPDCWLAMDTIAAVTPGRITLNFPAAHVADFARTMPRAA